MERQFEVADFPLDKSCITFRLFEVPFCQAALQQCTCVCLSIHPEGEQPPSEAEAPGLR